MQARTRRPARTTTIESEQSPNSYWHSTPASASECVLVNVANDGRAKVVVERRPREPAEHAAGLSESATTRANLPT